MSLESKENQSQRFARQVMMREMGAERQRRLARSKVLIVGMGGLGCPAAQYLVAAGIGSLVVMDPDTVELSNLNRQILFQESDIGKSKVSCAARRLQALSAATCIEALQERVDESNVIERVSACDVVLDCSDNLRTRYLVGDACAALDKPCVSAAVSGFDGQLAVFNEAAGLPCYRCAFPNPPDVRKIGNCAADGVIGAFVGILGSMQALEAIKLLAKFDTPHQKSSAVMRCLNGLTGEVTELRIPKRPDCPACSKSEGLLGKRLAERGASVALSVSLVGDSLWPLSLPAKVCQTSRSQVGKCSSIDALKLKELLGRALEPAAAVGVRVIDVRSAAEFAASHIFCAEHLALEDILASRFPFALDEEIILYCASGSRSLIAGEHLVDLGFRSVVHLSGGLASLGIDQTLIKEGGAQAEPTPLARHLDHVGGSKPRHCGAGDPAPA